MITVKPKKMVLKQFPTAFASRDGFGVRKCKVYIYYNGKTIGCGKSYYAAWLNATRRLI